jgi:hypothetical protein
MGHRWSLLLALAIACGAREPAEPLPTPPAPEVEAAPVEPLELHEWGLISDRVGGERTGGSRLPVREMDPSVLLQGARGLGIGVGSSSGTLRMRGGGKPVVYAHLPDGVDERTFDLGVRVPGGSVVEHWPVVAEGRPEEIAWRGVRAHRGACGERRYPSTSDPVCQTPDGFCEAALQPASIETADGACLEVAGASLDYLFYRAGMPSTPLPLDVTRTEDGGIDVRHRGGRAVPGRLIHVRRASLRDSTSVRVAEAPAPGRSTTLPATIEGTARSAADVLVQDARALGLTENEVDAFARAWTNELFGYEAPTEAVTLPASLEAPTEAVLYWMPPEELDAHLVLRVSGDVVIKRAILVRVGLQYE